MVKNREFAAPAVGRLAVDDFQDFGTFWRRLAAIVHHLPIATKIKLALLAQDEKHAGLHCFERRPVTRHASLRVE
jgi:hypothetical protein